MSDDRYELPLFDLPTHEPDPDLDALRRQRRRTADGDEAEHPDERVEVETLDLEARAAERGRASVPLQRAGVGPRLAAGFIDLIVHVALVGVLVGGSSLMGVTVELRHAPPLGFVLLLFSFLYHVVPLAFWGHTPGMAVAGLRARTLRNEPLSLPQATRRWLALLLTLATAGLGVLLALAGRSLADRLSDSQTLLS